MENKFKVGDIVTEAGNYEPKWKVIEVKERDNPKSEIRTRAAYKCAKLDGTSTIEFEEDEIDYDV